MMKLEALLERVGGGLLQLVFSIEKTIAQEGTRSHFVRAFVHVNGVFALVGVSADIDALRVNGIIYAVVHAAGIVWRFGVMVHDSVLHKRFAGAAHGFQRFGGVFADKAKNGVGIVSKTDLKAHETASLIDEINLNETLAIANLAGGRGRIAWIQKRGALPADERRIRAGHGLQMHRFVPVARVFEHAEPRARGAEALPLKLLLRAILAEAHGARMLSAPDALGLPLMRITVFAHNGLDSVFPAFGRAERAGKIGGLLFAGELAAAQVINSNFRKFALRLAYGILRAVAVIREKQAGKAGGGELFEHGIAALLEGFHAGVFDAIGDFFAEAAAFTGDKIGDAIAGEQNADALAQEDALPVFGETGGKGNLVELVKKRGKADDEAQGGSLHEALQGKANRIKLLAGCGGEIHMRTPPSKALEGRYSGPMFYAPFPFPHRLEAANASICACSAVISRAPVVSSASSASRMPGMSSCEKYGLSLSAVSRSISARIA
nr:MAG TPA: hypothetical protein [Caudoviricetes sp.]